MDPAQGTFIITRADQMAAPVMLVQTGILLGRLPSCHVVLNHPTVSRVHAGINRIGDDFYLINLSQANTLIINGRLLAAESADILAVGDVVEIGPFALVIERAGQQLAISIMQQASVTRSTGDLSSSPLARKLARNIPSDPSPSAGRGTGRLVVPGVNNVLKVFWKKRTRDRAERLSPLHPRERPLPGKARINWRPTGDLRRDWPGSIFTWAFIGIVALGAVAYVTYATAFAPAPVSGAHTRTTMTRPDAMAIANRANGTSCMSCHRPLAKLETACAECHQAVAFRPTIIEAHRQAGITCTNCHGEHLGASFNARTGAFASCTACHNDGNRQTYQGRKVSTPHGGTVGYPVRNGQWVWTGLDAEELTVLPDVAARLTVPDTLKDPRSRQFHYLHLERVRAAPGMAGNATGQVSCSTCHQSIVPIDTATPATTCAGCHQNFEPSSSDLRGADSGGAQINCTSCHVQHPLDADRWGRSLTDSARQDRTTAILNRIKAMPAH
jgi:hypothetical protein